MVLIVLVTGSEVILTYFHENHHYYLYFQIFTILTVTAIPLQCNLLRAEIKEQKLSSKLNMLRYVSHEMRTPLNIAILGSKVAIDSLKLVKLSMVDDSNRSSHSQDIMSDLCVRIKRVTGHCNLAVSTLDDVLTFDKLDEKKLTLELEPIDNPYVLIQDVINFYSDLISESNMAISLQSIPEYHINWFNGSQLHIDKCKIVQVLQNLISNAIKFNSTNGQILILLEQGTEALTIDCKASLRISVKDTGRGIPSEKLDKLLLQYRFVDAMVMRNGSHEGSGLGLWISRSKLLLSKSAD